MMPHIETSPSSKTKGELTGRHVLLAVIAFFGVLICINGVFIYAAVGTFRGEDVARSYRQGLDYNQTIEARRDQAALGWSAEIQTETLENEIRQITVVLTDALGQPVAYDQIEGRLRHPVDSSLDIHFETATEISGALKLSVPAGRRILIASAIVDGQAFNFRKSLVFE